MRARANRAAQAFENLAERYNAWYDTEPVAEPARSGAVAGAGFVALAAQRESAGAT